MKRQLTSGPYSDPKRQMTTNSRGPPVPSPVPAITAAIARAQQMVSPVRGPPGVLNVIRGPPVRGLAPPTRGLPPAGAVPAGRGGLPFAIRGAPQIGTPQSVLAQRATQSIGGMANLAAGIPARIMPAGVQIKTDLPRDPTELAIKFENEITQCFQTNNLDDAVQTYKLYVGKKVMPSLKIYLVMLTLYTTHDYQAGINEVIDDLLKFNASFTTLQLEAFVSIVSKSRANTKAIQVVRKERQKGIQITNPITHWELLTTAHTIEDALFVFGDMEKSGINITPIFIADALLKQSPDSVRPLKNFVMSKFPQLKAYMDRLNDLPRLKGILQRLTKMDIMADSSLIAKSWSAILPSEMLDFVESYLVLGGDLKSSLLENVFQTINSNECIKLFNTISTYKKRFDPAVIVALLQRLSSEYDERVFDVFQQAAAFIPCSAEAIVAVLKVSSFEGRENSLVARQVWQKFQTFSVRPSPDIAYLMIKSCVRDPSAMNDMVQVMLKSSMEIPQEALVIVQHVAPASLAALAQPAAVTTTPQMPMSYQSQTYW